MGQSNLIVYLNQERINPIGYGDEIIERYSEIKNTQFDEYKPGWIKSKISLNEFNDESDYFQLGSEDIYEAIQLEMDNFPGITSWNTHPSTNPSGLYKFTSLEIILN